jgi:hypothetical protein
MEAGWRCRDDEIADINGRLTRPIPSNINGTPAGKALRTIASGSSIWWTAHTTRTRWTRLRGMTR